MAANMLRFMRDEIIAGGILMGTTFLVLSIYTVLWLHNPFSPGDFGMGSAAILAAIGGGQGVRDWLSARGDDSPEASDVHQH